MCVLTPHLSDNFNEPSVIPLQALGVVDMAGNEVPDKELFSHALANTLRNAADDSAHRAALLAVE